ncbi:hypothetical protein [Streptomyces sp. NPDC001889]
MPGTWSRCGLGRPPREGELPDVDARFGKVLRASPGGTRLGRSRAPAARSLLLEPWRKADEANRPRDPEGEVLRT